MIASLWTNHYFCAGGNRSGPERARPSCRFVFGWLALCILAGVAILPGHADLPPQAQRYASEFISKEQGLPDGAITQLAQSGDGYLWVAMTTGLARFDGVRFDHYDHRNTPALPDDRVTALTTDRQGRIWAGTPKGLARWDRGRFASVSLDEDAGAITALASSTNGGVWVATASAVLRVGSDKPDQRFGSPPAWGTNAIGSLVELASGHLLVGSSSAWAELDPATGTYQAPTAGLMPPVLVRALIPDDAHGNAWAMDAQGIHRRTVQGWERVQAFPKEYDGKAAGLYRDPLGGVIAWIAQVGACRWENEQAGFVRLDSDPLHSETLRRPVAVLRDAEQNLWVASSGGLLRFQRRIAALWNKDDGLPSPTCWSASVGPDGRLWVGTQAGISVITEAGANPSLSVPVSTNATRLVLPTRGQRVWCVVADRALYWSDTPQAAGSWRLLPLGERHVKTLYEGADGSLWAGTEAGAVKITGQAPAVTPFAGQEQLNAFEITAIRQDRHGALWFGTQSGVIFQAEGENCRRFAGSDLTGESPILCIQEDSDGGMWFGTRFGISYRRDQRWYFFGPDQGLGDHLFLGIYEDAVKHFWLVSKHGLQRVGRAELEAVATGASPRVLPLNFGILDGVENCDFAGYRQPTGALDKLGQLWLPTTQGLLQVDPRRLPDNSPPPAVLMSGASFGEQIIGEALVRQFCSATATGSPPAGRPEYLSVPQELGHFVQLHFTASSFLQPRNILFRYRLQGYEQAWNKAVEGRTATYRNLPAGDYTFEVEASNPHGAWNSVGMVFRFSLTPRFYETRWFMVACFAVLLLGAMIFARHHYRSNEQRLRGDRRALEQERSRIARDLHDDLGANLTGLAMQAEIAGRQLSGPGAEELQRFAVTTRSLAQRLREVIWAVDPESDTLESLTAFLGQQTDELLGATRLRYRFDAPPHLPAIRLRAGTRHQLAMSAREALNNILKYAQASEVMVRLELADDTLSITISDNGVGLPSGSVTQSGRPVTGGQGLKNIRQRLKSLGGNFRVSSAPGAGTLVRLEVPLAAVTAVESKPDKPSNEHQSRDR